MALCTAATICTLPLIPHAVPTHEGWSVWLVSRRKTRMRQSLVTACRSCSWPKRRGMSRKRVVERGWTGTVSTRGNVGFRRTVFPIERTCRLCTIPILRPRHLWSWIGSQQWAWIIPPGGGIGSRISWRLTDSGQSCHRAEDPRRQCYGE